MITVRQNRLEFIRKRDNFILKPAPANQQQNQKTYSDPELSLHPQLSNTIGSFVNK